MEENKQRLVIEGNSVYELDLECLRKKKERRNEKNCKIENKDESNKGSKDESKKRK